MSNLVRVFNCCEKWHLGTGWWMYWATIVLAPYHHYHGQDKSWATRRISDHQDNILNLLYTVDPRRCQGLSWTQLGQSQRGIKTQLTKEAPWTDPGQYTWDGMIQKHNWIINLRLTSLKAELWIADIEINLFRSTRATQNWATGSPICLYIKSHQLQPMIHN